MSSWLAATVLRSGCGIGDDVPHSRITKHDVAASIEHQTSSCFHQQSGGTGNVLKPGMSFLIYRYVDFLCASIMSTRNACMSDELFSKFVHSVNSFFDAQ